MGSLQREELCDRPAFCPELRLAINVGKKSGLSKLSSDSTLYCKVAARRGTSSSSSSLTIYQLVRVTRNLNDREFKINILINHYCHVIEHGLKCRETYFI